MGKQSHVCSFCQGAGHTRATCPLPGAALLRTLLQQAEYRGGRMSKQEGRSKPKFSPGSFGGLKKKLRLAYSGKKKPRTDNLPSASRKCKLFGHRLDCAQQVLEDLVAEGLLRFPKKCLCCRRGRYPRQVLYLPARQRADGQAVFSQGQYVLRCDCCGHRLNTVALGPWGKKFRSKMNLLQLDTFFSEYVRSTSRPLSATTAGRLCQVGLRASRVFLDFFLQKAAEAGFVALLLFPQVPELFPLLLLFFFCLSRGWAAPERGPGQELQPQLNFSPALLLLRQRPSQRHLRAISDLEHVLHEVDGLKVLRLLPLQGLLCSATKSHNTATLRPFKLPLVNH